VDWPGYPTLFHSGDAAIVQVLYWDGYAWKKLVLVSSGEPDEVEISSFRWEELC
jgi:hypothetical protein